MKQKIGPELARVLVKRITKALDNARYYPASHADTEATAQEVVRPYLEKPAVSAKGSGISKYEYEALGFGPSTGGVLLGGIVDAPK